MPEKKTHRVQIELPKRSMARLNALKERTEAVSYAEVFRNAMTLYEWAIERADKNESIFVETSEGKQSKVELLV